MTLRELFLTFLKLGATGFGGPIALIALMEQEFVRRRKLLSAETFNENYVFCKLLPGPVAVQMSLAIGRELAGRAGGVAAGLAFVIPGLVLIVLLAASYGVVAGSPFLGSLFLGMRLAALAIIADSVVRMARPLKKDPAAWAVVPLAALAFYFFRSYEPLIILAAGLAFVVAPPARAMPVVVWPALWPLFWVHFKAGSFVFGTGLAILPFLQEEVVNVHHWLTLSQFLDGIAFGQITPGPVTVTSAFVGYRAAGVVGAVSAALGMYLPGVILVLFVVPWLQARMQGKSTLLRFQRGAIPAVVGCIVGALYVLGRTELTSLAPLLIVLGLTALAVFTRWPGWAVLLLGAPMGPLLAWLTGRT